MKLTKTKIVLSLGLMATVAYGAAVLSTDDTVKFGSRATTGAKTIEFERGSGASNPGIRSSSTGVVEFKNNAGSFTEAVTTSGQQILTNKDIDGGTATNSNRLTLPKGSTAALSALNNKEGTIAYDTTLGKPVVNTGAQNIEVATIADISSSGEENLIENGRFESNVVGWSAYKDAAITVPIDGTGGTADSLSVNHVSNTDMSGLGHMSIDYTGAASPQGQGVSYDFQFSNIEKDSTKYHTISFNYDASDAGYNPNDIIVCVMTTTGAFNNLRDMGHHFTTLKTKEGNCYGIPKNQGAAQFLFRASTFTTNARVVFHYSSTNSGTAWGVNIDDVVIKEYNAPFNRFLMKVLTPGKYTINDGVALSFSNLRIGQLYRLSGSVSLQHDGSLGSFVSGRIFHDGVLIERRAFAKVDASSVFSRNAINTIFVATDDTVELICQLCDATKGLYGDDTGIGYGNGTYLILEELNNYEYAQVSSYN